MMKNNMREAAEVLRAGKSFLVMSHIGPDGDAFGSMCAFRLAAEGMGKAVTMLSPDGITDVYKFLPGSQLFINETPKDRRFDVGVVLDCDGPARLGPAREALALCDKTIEFDHHPGTDRVTDVQVIDPSAASTGEILYEFLLGAGVKLSYEIAECLLTAIVTDTGCFRFSNVKASTLRAAAGLVEQGISISKIVQKVYETRSLAAAKILGVALASLQTALDGQVAYAYLTREQMQAAGADEGETEGIVNYVRSVRGARIGLLFREGEEGSTRVSFRSVDGTDISQIARLFGGGGHKTASGATLNRPLHESIDLVLSAIQKWMAS
jgi:bifunctional oligoribonuclease and PAP phosphatase NrnA